MRRGKTTEIQSFNDGLAKIYEVTNTAASGDRPKDGLTVKEILRYAERTVGMGRYYAGLQYDVRVARVLRCQRRASVSTQDVVIPTDGMQYKIVQVQYPDGVTPPAMDLSLERIDKIYDIG